MVNFVSRDPVIRFWEKVDKNGPIPEYHPELGPCWIWKGATKDRYGRFFITAEKPMPAHRYAYEQQYGPIPKGLEPDHLCRVRPCVRPSHLEAVTSKENNMRGISPPSKNAKKMHCINGHPLSGKNLLIQVGPYSQRKCRICTRRAQRDYRTRIKVSALAAAQGKP